MSRGHDQDSRRLRGRTGNKGRHPGARQGTGARQELGGLSTKAIRFRHPATQGKMQVRLTVHHVVRPHIQQTGHFTRSGEGQPHQGMQGPEEQGGGQILPPNSPVRGPIYEEREGHTLGVYILKLFAKLFHMYHFENKLFRESRHFISIV